MACTKLRRKVRNGLANDHQLVDDGASQHAIRLERLPRLSLDELSDRIRRRDDVFKKKPLTPYR